jgi:hypothetical protein
MAQALLSELGSRHEVIDSDLTRLPEPRVGWLARHRDPEKPWRKLPAAPAPAPSDGPASGIDRR